MDFITTLGLIAGTLTTVAYLPQLIKTWQSESAEDLSWSMLITLCVGIVLWLMYGTYIHDLPVILANLVTLVLALVILTLKIRYKLKSSNFKYAKQLLGNLSDADRLTG